MRRMAGVTWRWRWWLKQRGDHELVGEEVTAARKYWRDADRNLRELAELRKLESQGAVAAN